MGLTDFFNNIKYNYLGKKMFQGEVEAFFYSHKKINLPKIPEISQSTLQGFKENYPFRFYKDQDDFDKAASELLKLENGETILNLAQSVIENKYDILCSGEIFLGEKINWLRDYKSNYEWKTGLYWQNNFFDVPKGVDLKYPWELARFHQALWLGKAYLITGDEKYTKKFLDLWNDFNESNILCGTINWLNSKEVAIRFINIIFAFGFFMKSNLIDADVCNRLLNFVLLYSYYLENNLGYSARRDSRYLSGLLGLAFAGLIIRDHPYGKKNINLAKQRFEQEIRTQVYPDGVSYEQSVPYHSTILEKLYIAKIYFEKYKYKFSEGYNERLEKMFNVQSAYLRKDNSVPVIGDIISSPILAFTNSAGNIDFSYTLPFGAYLFNSSKLRYFNSSHLADLLYFFGPSAVAVYKNINIESPDFRSIGFTQGGHFILRTFNANLFIEAGDVGKNGGGAPGHDDTFTYDLYYKNKGIISDSGTYSYFNDTRLRNWLRSVMHHNSVYIDNENLTKYDGVFKSKGDITKPEVIEWITDKNEDHLAIQHHAYLRLTDPVVCKRSFNFIKTKNIIKIKDEFVGGAVHQATARIHLHSEAEVTKISENEFAVKRDDAEIKITFDTSAENFYTIVQDTEFSASYGHLTVTKKIVFSINDVFPAYINTEIELL